jgi:hypothetical protein
MFLNPNFWSSNENNGMLYKKEITLKKIRRILDSMDIKKNKGISESNDTIVNVTISL